MYGGNLPLFFCVHSLPLAWLSGHPGRTDISLPVIGPHIVPLFLHVFPDEGNTNALESLKLCPTPNLVLPYISNWFTVNKLTLNWDKSITIHNFKKINSLLHCVMQVDQCLMSAKLALYKNLFCHFSLHNEVYNIGQRGSSERKRGIFSMKEKFYYYILGDTIPLYISQ
jgi:hypothetical protein